LICSRHRPRAPTTFACPWHASSSARPTATDITVADIPTDDVDADDAEQFTIDPVLEDIEGGIEASALDAPDD
jgi:hypothetical protein